VPARQPPKGLLVATIAIALTMQTYQAPQRRRIILMRHGSVSYYLADGTPVDANAVGLNDRGIKQAQAAGALLAQAGVRVDRVITSDLLRTRQSAEIVLNAMQTQSVPRQSALKALQEIRKGSYEALEDVALHEAFLGIFRGCPSGDTRFQGGESIDEVYARVLPVVKDELADPDWHTALWVLHGGINRALISWWLCAPQGWLGNLLQQPACINLIDAASRPEDSIVRAVNLWPGDWLQADERHSTIELQLLEYERGLLNRKSALAQGRADAVEQSDEARSND